MLVILGATGDLMRHKVLPAIFHLFENRQLPSFFSLLGVSNQTFDNESFQNFAKQVIKEHLNNKSIPPEEFLDYFSYQKGSFEDEVAYQDIALRLAKVDQDWGVCSNKLFYIASPPRFFETVINNLSTSGLTQPCSKEQGWTRVLVEKPFGKSLHEAIFLDHLLSDVLKEEQIYRIDHYLAKEMLQNIILFRFANNLLEETWNKNFIERIDIKVLEEIGIEGRADFYDNLGALLDVGQNHIMQMLALATMENPLEINAEAIRNKRKEILKHLEILDFEQVKNQTVRGQFKDYQKVEGVKANSTTETYFKIKAFLDLEKWRGVPLYLEGGKRLPVTQKEIVIQFRHPVPCLCSVLAMHYRNYIHFRMEPNPGITIKFWSKKPGRSWEVEEKHFDFKYPFKKLKHPYLEEYSRLMLDAIEGDQTLFISSEEALAAWHFIDPIVRSWRKEAVPLNIYQNDRIFEAGKQIEAPSLPEGKPIKEIGLVGLGKMGGNMARRLMEKGRRVVGYNLPDETTRLMEKEGLIGAYSLQELAAKIKQPRIIWLMIPAGKTIDKVIFGQGKQKGLAGYLSKGDIIIDGGNSFYQDSTRRSEELKKQGIIFVDVGVSGGPEGARKGASLMVGGDSQTYNHLFPLYTDLAVSGGVEFFEGTGAGHFVKMIHNGIEYSMMQSIAEGFNILKESGYNISLKKAAKVYNHGSVIQSRLIGWLKDAYDQYTGELHGVKGSVGHTGEGEWTVQTAKKMGLEAKNIEQALNFRIESENKPSYTGRILTALRNQFGKHGVKRESKKFRKAG